ncbi:hypothetical protein D3C86_1338920 [compost metagenome]
MGLAGRHHQVQFIGTCRQGPLRPLEVGDQGNVDDARLAVDTPEHVLTVAQCRDGFGGYEGAGLDAAESGQRQLVDQVDLVWRGDPDRLDLQAIARRDFLHDQGFAVVTNHCTTPSLCSR